MIHHKKVEHLDRQWSHLLLTQQFLHHRYKQMFPAPQPRLLQVALLKLTQLTHQVNKRLDRVTLLLIITILVVAGLRDQVGVDMEEDTKY